MSVTKNEEITLLRFRSLSDSTLTSNPKCCEKDEFELLTPGTSEKASNSKDFNQGGRKESMIDVTKVGSITDEDTPTPERKSPTVTESRGNDLNSK